MEIVVNEIKDGKYIKSVLIASEGTSVVMYLKKDVPANLEKVTELLGGLEKFFGLFSLKDISAPPTPPPTTRKEIGKIRPRYKWIYGKTMRYSEDEKYLRFSNVTGGAGARIEKGKIQQLLQLDRITVKDIMMLGINQNAAHLLVRLIEENEDQYGYMLTREKSDTGKRRMVLKKKVKVEIDREELKKRRMEEIKTMRDAIER